MIRPYSAPRSRLLIALVVVMMTMLSCATRIETWINPRVARLELDGWLELTSPDFVLYSRGSREDLERFATDLARYIAVVERLVNAQTPKAPAHLVLVAEHAEALFIYDPRLGGYMGSTLTGFSGFVRGSRYDARIRAILLHEFTHYLTLRSTRLTYPVWYQEGFADFLGTIRTRGDIIEIGSRMAWRLESLDARARADIPIDLEEIFSFKKGAGRSYPRDFYPISWATVHYLNSNPNRQQRLVTMIAKQAAGLDAVDAYAQSFSIPIKALARKVENHAAALIKGASGAVLHLPLETLVTRTNWSIREFDPHESARFLGEFAAHGVISSSPEYAQVLATGLFERALELAPDDSRSHAGLASTLSARGMFEEADVHLEAFALDPNPSAVACLYAGLAKQQQAGSTQEPLQRSDAEKLRAEARGLFERAIRLEPENALAVAGLGRIQLAAEEFELARNLFAQAQRLGEWDAELALDRGRVEQRTGHLNRAREYWNEVIQLGSEKQAEKASELLKEAYQAE